MAGGGCDRRWGSGPGNHAGGDRGLRIGGSLLARHADWDVHHAGRYTVNGDCTGTETADLGGGVLAHYDNFLSPDGSMYTAVQTDAGVVVTEVFHRVPLHSNDDRSTQ